MIEEKKSKADLQNPVTFKTSMIEKSRKLIFNKILKILNQKFRANFKFWKK